MRVLAVVAEGGAVSYTHLDVYKRQVFAGIEAAKFRRPVVPGDQLRIEVTVLNWRTTAVKLRGVATVDGEVACEATIMCMPVSYTHLARGSAWAAVRG